MPQKNEKTFRNQTLRQKSHQMNKEPANPSCKILWFIIKINEEGAQTDRPEDREINDDTQSIIPKR